MDFEYETQKHTMGVGKHLENSKATACVNSQLICGWPSLFTSSSLVAKETQALWPALVPDASSNSFVKETRTIVSEMCILGEQKYVAIKTDLSTIKNNRAQYTRFMNMSPII